MNKFNIRHYSTYSTIKAGMAERVIRTIKTKFIVISLQKAHGIGLNH